MACELCSRSCHCCQSYNHAAGYEVHHYSDVPAVSENIEEPVAPTLSLGNRILWLTDFQAASGIVRWIGRIPSVSSEWTAGVEFDNVMPGGGNGNFHGRTYFMSRPGHSLFLPVSDLINVNDNTSRPTRNGERSFFGRLQESCSNIAHRRRRDATFGHFKHEYCSNCAQSEFSYNGHHCNRAPVYDRITSRRSLCYDEHPYEAFVPCSSQRNPCISNACERRALTECQNFRLGNSIAVSAVRNEENSDCRDYSSNGLKMNVFQKDSFFNPRASLRLISDFKEWVACLMTGTNRRKRKTQLVLKDRRSVTSVFLTQNSHSVTGQRLSSFSEYSSVNVSRKSSKSDTVVPDPLLKKSSVVADHGNQSAQRVIRRKKRPAPVPPTAVLSGPPKHEVHTYVKTNAKLNPEAITKSGVLKESTQNGTGYKVVRSNSVRSVTISARKRHKKRKAPPPPVVRITGGRFENELSREKVNINDTSNKHRNGNNNQERNNSNNQVVKLSKSKLKQSQLKASHQNMRSPYYDDSVEFADASEESESEDERASPRSISFSEEESEEDKYGLVKYRIRRGLNATEDDMGAPSTSTYLPYPDNNNDVCLKISIQKTETNVVTVEEVSAPHIVEYNIEESTTDLSDDPDYSSMKKIANSSEPKVNSTDSSTEEATDKSKTIFEELQMKPPVKGSVKDFVSAFNMLASKNNGENRDRKQSIVDSVQNKPSISNGSPAKAGKSTLSFPTKWEYQTSTCANFPLNKFLLPIEEESNNDTSEYDGNANADDKDSRLSKSKKKPSHQVASISGRSDNSIKVCSHCSEKHTPPCANERKKTNASKNMKVIYDSAKSKKSASPTQASMAAISSLLNENTEFRNGKGKTTSANNENWEKMDQPIMVGLYIEDKSSHRGPIPLLVTPSMSLKRLKKQMEKEYEIPRHQQCWILGESFAVADENSLASYGVTDPGCPILLYAMAKDSKSHSLPSKSRFHHSKIVRNHSDSSDEGDVSLQKQINKIKGRSKFNDQQQERKLKNSEYYEIERQDKWSKTKPHKVPSRSLKLKNASLAERKKSDYHRAWEAEYEKNSDYRTLVALDDVDLVLNTEVFECPICFLEVEPGNGATLQDCLHSFCKECLASSVQYSETAVIKCPFRNDDYSCESHLQEREIKSLVPQNIYERHLQKSMALAESQAQDSFHCKTPDCPGWCLFEDNVNTFLCPVCKKTNCLTCAAIHEGKNCRQYQDDVAVRCDSSEEARKTKEYLKSMVESGEAMECPQCQVIMMKKWGCDWLKCSMCHTEVCWVTKGPRWGPGGRGDTSGGCKCMLNGVRCHPKCSYCH